MSLRTLRNWKKQDPAARVAPPGRPRLSEREREQAREAVRAELERKGWGAGEEPIWRALGGALPRARVRAALQELKTQRRQRLCKEAQERRVSIEVSAADALWSLDATHLGRDQEGKAVWGEVLRDVASTRTIEVAVGPAACGAEVVTLLDNAVLARGSVPLVLVTDNGSAYRCELVADWCRTRKVLHLFSLPRTPQHNAWAEHGMRELKEDAALGKGVLVHDIEWARERLVRSRDRLDGARLRRSRGWRTAREADAQAPHWAELVDREAVFENASCEIERTVLDSMNERARRRAVREAILGTLEHFSVITRTRGGRPLNARNAEDDS